MNKITNKVLKALKNREEYAFDIVVDTYRELLYGTIYKMVMNKTDAEDLLFDVFQKLWDHADNIIINKVHFRNWLITIAYNVSRNFLKLKKKEDYYRIYDDDAIDVSYDANSILSSLYLADMQRFMTDEEYKVLIYKDIKKMNYLEISKIMDINDKTVKVYYLNAKKIVKKYYEGDL